MENNFTSIFQQKFILLLFYQRFHLYFSQFLDKTSSGKSAVQWQMKLIFFNDLF